MYFKLIYFLIVNTFYKIKLNIQKFKHCTMHNNGCEIFIQKYYKRYVHTIDATIKYLYLLSFEVYKKKTFTPHVQTTNTKAA